MNNNCLRPVTILTYGGIVSLLAYYSLTQNINYYVQSLTVFTNFIMTILTVPAQFHVHVDQLFILLEEPNKLSPIKIDGLEFIYTAQASSTGLLATAVVGLRRKIVAIMYTSIALFFVHFVLLLFAAIGFVHHYLALFPTASIISEMFFLFYTHATPALLIITWFLLSTNFLVGYLMELASARGKSSI